MSICDKEKKIDFYPMGRCYKCGKLYGDTNATYKDAKIMFGCGCMPRNSIYFLNGSEVRFIEDSEGYKGIDPELFKKKKKQARKG